jgi:hypothetical protein
MFDKKDKSYRAIAKYLIVNRFNFHLITICDKSNYEKYEGKLNDIPFCFECNKYDNGDNYCILEIDSTDYFYYDYLNLEVVQYLAGKLGYVRDERDNP